MAEFFRNNKTAIVIFLLAILSGFFWGHRLFFDQKLRFGGDQVIYDGIAWDLVTIHTYTDRGSETFIEPFYPLVVACIYKIFGHNPLAVRIFQLIIFGLTSVLIYFLGRRLFDEKIGLISGVISAIFYGFAGYVTPLLRENLLIFLFVLLVYFLYLALQQKKTIFFIISGLILGSITLTNSTAQFLFIPVAIFFVIMLRKMLTGRRIFFKTFLFVLAFIIVLSPWMIRSAILAKSQGPAIAPRTGQMLAMRAYFMETLYPQMPKYFLGHLIGYYFVQKIDSSLEIKAFRNFKPLSKMIRDLQDQGYSYNEIDAILIKRSVNKIVVNPQKYLLMSALDFINFNNPVVPQRIFDGPDAIYFTFTGDGWPGVPEFIKAALLLVVRFIWYSFFFFVIYAIVTMRRDWLKIGWLFIIIIYFNAIYSAIHAIPRYAMPIYPFYIILAVAGLSFAFKKLRQKSFFNFIRKNE